MTNCIPQWYPILDDPVKKSYRLVSGCALASMPACASGLSAGNIKCNPADMAARADREMRFKGYTGPTVTVDAYTLARYIASEVGSSATPGEKVAVAEAAVNRARRWKLSIQGLLLNRSPAPNKGFYGPIHCQNADGSLGAPYGRWAATSKDPSIADVLAAQLVMSGSSNNFARGADDQADLTSSSFPNPSATIRNFAQKRSYWAGPIPGVDHRKTFLFAYRPDIAPDSATGVALVQAGIAAISAPSPNWSGLETCPSGSKWPAVLAFGAAATLGYLLYRRRDYWINRLIPGRL